MFYINGNFVSKDHAKISVLDLGLLRGYGVFDYLRTYHGRPFHLKEHLQRLDYSAQQIGLTVPKTHEAIEAIIEELLKLNGYPESSIKILITGGESSDQFTPQNSPSLIILVYPLKPFPQLFYEDGIKACTTSLARSMPTCKTIHYIPAIIALQHAHKKEAQEILYLNAKGEILEAATSNFFAIQQNKLITPSSDEVLFGITREVLLHLVKDRFEIVQRSISFHEIGELQEAFLTSSNKEVMPLVKIDHHPIGDGKVGEKTKDLIKLFSDYTKCHNWPFLKISRYL